ncbi:MAG: DNA-directed RNA polymerase subunit beta' [Deltaproteobacteria bacterium]|jgi:DNA-directed RNA polymerase subunit beta'|nr:DNA-directed RNA polymerase subunit beta' [Deltaproteobacteria bacterium]
MAFRDLFEIAENPNIYSAVRIKIATSDEVTSWSHGEVRTSETINYRTFKPERDGLFCGKIFGPVHDYECICGKYKRMKHRGITCEKCGVEVIESKVRRDRMGNIKLACPVSHVWFLKGVPSRIATILDMMLRDLERVLYFDAYIVLDPGDSDREPLELVEENEYRELEENHPDLKLGMGAEAVQTLLRRIDLEELEKQLQIDMREVNSETRRKRIAKRLNVISSLLKSGNAVDSMIIDNLPVLPPELRPLVPLEGGRFATSDLNDLYRRVIHRNNRLKRLIELRAPGIIVKNEKRMLQESVDALFDNGRRGRPMVGSNKRPLKSISDMLKGKQGRFRQNLLGKRVDYSGRTVIVVGPELKLHQCGLPKKMALELFKPFIFHKLIDYQEIHTIKNAKKVLEENPPEVWAILEEVVREHPVLLNRAPTLHRLGIQAFEPILIEGKAIQLHPLVCTAFNADFDGDQMAVHVPLSVEAQLESKILMMSTNNVLSPANGKPVMTPTQDMVLGLYWITREHQGALGEGKIFSNREEVQTAYDHSRVDLHAKIKVRLETNNINQTVSQSENPAHKKPIIESTVGRVLLSMVVPEEVPFESVNMHLKKKHMAELVDESYRKAGSIKTVKMLDDLKNMGYAYATKAGFSIGMDDMVIPEEKEGQLRKAQTDVNTINMQHQDGLITDGERYNQVIDIWARTTEKIAEKMSAGLSDEIIDEEGVHKVNSIFMMADSGARGSNQQMKQLAGMRGLMAKPSGEIIETPIHANFREGLNVLEYFISTHGARKGLADTALKTANSGYLTRRLVDVSQDSVVLEEDCGTLDGIEMTALIESGEIIEPLGDRILGRVLLEDVIDPDSEFEILIPAGTLISETEKNAIENSRIEKVQIRSPLTCMTEKGVCRLCYGRDLCHGDLVNLGETVGVIAAQSIGEPGTQLTMRTFHIGGTASRSAEQNKWEAGFSGVLRFDDLKEVKNREGNIAILGRRGEAVIVEGDKTIKAKALGDLENERERERRPLPMGATLLKQEGTHVEQGELIAEWDPFSIPIITDVSGIVDFQDISEGETFKEQVDEVSGVSRKVIHESQSLEQRPVIAICDKKKKTIIRDNGTPTEFALPIKSELMVENGIEVHAGDVLAKIPRELARNKDITGGLPRVAELFEARVPKDQAIITEIDGIVEFDADVKKKQRIRIRPEDGKGDSKEYLIPRGRHITVHMGEYVRAGDPLIDGSPNPHDILAVKGSKALQKYLVDEVQQVYRLQGVGINDKHIEVIVRQMLRKAYVEEPGDSSLLVGQEISRIEFDRINRELVAEGRRPARSKPKLLGITKASLGTDSFISAASFQDTTKVLTDAALGGKHDTFRGLKENVILGRLIPAGTGFNVFDNVDYELGEGVIDPEALRRAADEAARAAMERELAETGEYTKPEYLVVGEAVRGAS